MRSEVYLGLILAFAPISMCWGQQTPPSTSASEPQASPSSSSTESSPEKPVPEEATPHALRVLPPDVAPNPPRAEELAASQMTWKGEYEADAIGLPILGPDSRPVPVLYNKKGKRIKSKVKPPKTHPINVVAGTLTVDGWTGKARLNYVIPDLRYIYISVPFTGTIVVAQAAFPGAKEQKEAFNGKTLTIAVDEHSIELASEKPLLGKLPGSAWVKLDPDFREDPRYPVMGYGSTPKAPYEWPGAKRVKTAGALDPPPLPSALMPKLEDTCGSKSPCAPKAKPTTDPNPGAPAQ